MIKLGPKGQVDSFLNMLHKSYTPTTVDVTSYHPKASILHNTTAKALFCSFVAMSFITFGDVRARIRARWWNCSFIFWIRQLVYT